MRLQDIIHETWDFIGSSLNALTEAANAELMWASGVSGVSLKEMSAVTKLKSSESLGTQVEARSLSLDQMQPATDSKKRKDSNECEESKRQRSDSSFSQTELSSQKSSKLSVEIITSGNSSLGSAQVSDLHELERDDKKQIKVVLKGRTRHKAKELQHQVGKSTEARTEAPQNTSPTTKVVNLASKADESRLNSDKRLQSTVSSSLDILRKGLMKKPLASDLNQPVIVDTGKRVIDSSGNSISSINTSFVRSSNPEMPAPDSESVKLPDPIPRESTVIDRLSKIIPTNHLKSLAIESASLEKDRKLFLDSFQETHLKSQEKPEKVLSPKESQGNSLSTESNISHIPSLKEINPKTPVVSKIPLETVPQIQNTILDALDDKQDAVIHPNIPAGKSCILDENGNLPEIQSDDSEDDHKLSPPKVANWAHTPHLRGTLESQKLQDPDAIFGTIPPIHLEDVFKNIPAKKFTRPRASSGVWSSLTPDEIAMYKSRMGFKGQN